ncbi:hypothetical protein KPB2_5537 [Klebsiella pneumoniae Kb677]|nr:hypothetical protein KPB2_5537 [Klebsiella pneumoniae Kb677]
MSACSFNACTSCKNIFDKFPYILLLPSFNVRGGALIIFSGIF